MPNEAKAPAGARAWVVGAVLAVIFLAVAALIGAGLWQRYHRNKPVVHATDTTASVAVAETAVALDRLGDIQRAWLSKDVLAAGVDRDDALARLREAQLAWWNREGFHAQGDDEGHPIDRLETMQQAWWEEEGLAAGKLVQDADVLLDRLALLNRRWWDAVHPTQSVLAAGDPEEPAPANAPNEEAALELRAVAGTRNFLEAGGSEESEKAVQLGLKWLASQQLPDGRWRFENVGHAQQRDVAPTAMGLLPFLARGYAHKTGPIANPYVKQVSAGIGYLVKQQKNDGDLRAGSNMYTHALATMALCEAFNMTSDSALREPCKKAIDFIVRAQARDGGWRYTPAPPASDMSVTSWNLMALKSGQMAGLHIPAETLQKANGFVQLVHRSSGGFCYRADGRDASRSMSAAGLTCSHYLLGPGSSRSVRQEDINAILGTRNSRTAQYYFLYYSVYALFPVGGETWKKWNPYVRDLLVKSQNQGAQNPAFKGSWDPKSGSIDHAGRVAVTSLALLTLEVYYRHLPLNQPDLGEMAKDVGKAKK
jgi:hypothetical protein